MSEKSLSNFGQEQIERIATEKATQFNSSVGKYADLRYHLALFVGLANFGVVLSFIVMLLVAIVKLELSAGVAAVGYFVLAYLLKRLSQWLTPNEVDF